MHEKKSSYSSRSRPRRRGDGEAAKSGQTSPKSGTSSRKASRPATARPPSGRPWPGWCSDRGRMASARSRTSARRRRRSSECSTPEPTGCDKQASGEPKSAERHADAQPGAGRDRVGGVVKAHLGSVGLVVKEEVPHQTAQHGSTFLKSGHAANSAQSKMSKAHGSRYRREQPLRHANHELRQRDWTESTERRPQISQTSKGVCELCESRHPRQRTASPQGCSLSCGQWHAHCVRPKAARPRRRDNLRVV